MKGIDVSSYQGTIDWKKVKNAGVNFAILKVIRKDLNPDKKFESNWQGCADVGMTVQGVYNYSYATTVAKAQSDAEKVVKILAGRKPMVWLDVEDKVQAGLGHTLVDIINIYASVIQGAGLSFGVYTGLSFYNTYLIKYATELPYIFWIARYPSKAVVSVSYDPPESKSPQIKNEYFGWQYSSNGHVDGISGAVDLNLTNDTVAAPVMVQNVAQHIQINYQPGIGYCLTCDLNVRDGAGVNGKKLKVLKRGTWVLNNATTRVGESIWMYIGQDKYNGKMVDQWICADTGSICYALNTQV